MTVRTHAGFRTWFDTHRAELDAIVFDIDGVLTIGKAPVPEAVGLLQALRELGFPFSFLTNDGQHSHEQKARHLQSAGLHVAKDEIVSCGDGLTILAESENLKGSLFFLMGDMGIPCYAEGAGLAVTRDVAELGDCRGVIIGEKNYDWETCLNAVINHFVADDGAYLIVPNPDDFYLVAPDRLELASGAPALLIVRILEECGKTVEVRMLGKPYAPIYAYHHRILEARTGRTIAHDRVMMLGDSLRSDIRGAMDFGYRSGLLLTGITTQKMLAKSEVKPEHVFRHL
jgi:HAD superfamily hydrolase (TIGR01450 family)